MDKQNTLNKEVSLEGVGLHTGQKVKLTFKPAPEDHGIVFQRIDVEGQPKVQAIADNVTEVQRGTTIEKKGARVNTVEHVMSSLVALQIDNCLIELNGDEVPIMDGSAKPFIDLLKTAGVKQQEKIRRYYEVKETIIYKDEVRGVELMVVPDDKYSVTAMIDFNSPVLGTQHATLDKLEDFEENIASSRTFCFLHELEQLLNHNLIKGGDLSNAIVVVDKVVQQNELDKLAKLFNRTHVEVKQEGILNNVELRHQNEPARHKLLDVVGDLGLVGAPIKGKVIAKKPGHAANVEFAKIIRKKMEAEKDMAPRFDLTKTVYDINKIMELLPHRPPFLMIDRILEMEKERIVGCKNITINEAFFQGHFPGKPIFPGVLQLEAMAQVGGILALSQVPDPENYLTYFMKIDKVKFRHPVVPGDTIIFDLHFVSPFRRGIVHMGGYAYVGDKIVAEAEMMAQLAKVK
ncbi:MAG: bifunctional UDP-3-O-[3-hydroxymyristoyl] N-acetylglucosamine deacetylase/3-hydroxyacyl-ACP dehydratase [Flavobacteriales bacterium]